MKYMTVWMNLTDIMLNERIWTQAHIVEINLYKVKEQTNESLIIEISSGCLCTWQVGGRGGLSAKIQKGIFLEEKKYIYIYIDIYRGDKYIVIYNRENSLNTGYLCIL